MASHATWLTMRRSRTSTIMAGAGLPAGGCRSERLAAGNPDRAYPQRIVRPRSDRRELLEFRSGSIYILCGQAQRDHEPQQPGDAPRNVLVAGNPTPDLAFVGVDASSKTALGKSNAVQRFNKLLGCHGILSDRVGLALAGEYVPGGFAGEPNKAGNYKARDNKADHLAGPAGVGHGVGCRWRGSDLASIASECSSRRPRR